MKEANVRFDFDGYDVICEAEVWSPADVRELQLTFIGMSKSEVKEIDRATLKIVKEVAKEQLVSHVFEGELEF